MTTYEGDKRLSTAENTSSSVLIDHIESMLARMHHHGAQSEQVEELIESANGWLRNRLRNIRDNIINL